MIVTIRVTLACARCRAAANCFDEARRVAAGAAAVTDTAVVTDAELATPNGASPMMTRKASASQLHPATENLSVPISPKRANSIVESWRRSVKHSWRFINSLGSRATVQRLVTVYVKEYKEVVPHGSIDGRIPNEAYFNPAEDEPIKLTVARTVARKARLTANRATTRETCWRSKASSFVLDETARPAAKRSSSLKPLAKCRGSSGARSTRSVQRI